MKEYVIGLIILGLIVLSGIAMAEEYCPACNTVMHPTGEVRGNMFLYKCGVGHAWWIKAPSSRPPSGGDAFSSGPKCPVCGTSAHPTGEIYVEFGRLFKVYNCGLGHRSVGR